MWRLRLRRARAGASRRSRPRSRHATNVTGRAPARARPRAPRHGDAARRVEVERSLLAENDARAARLRAQLSARGIEAIGLLGGPGAGKTALLEATFARLGAAARDEAVVEGDCATDLDARRIAACGARVAQVATGSLCHLDAHLVEHALEALDLRGVARVFVENVGNLVCPAPSSCGESRAGPARLGARGRRQARQVPRCLRRGRRPRRDEERPPPLRALRPRALPGERARA